MRSDPSTTEDAGLLAAEVRRLADALADATAEIAGLCAEVERRRCVALPARGRVRCGAEVCEVPATGDQGDAGFSRQGTGGTTAPTLTDAERKAVAWAIEVADSLRGLIARLGGDA